MVLVYMFSMEFVEIKKINEPIRINQVNSKDASIDTK